MRSGLFRLDGWDVLLLLLGLVVGGFGAHALGVALDGAVPIGMGVGLAAMRGRRLVFKDEDLIYAEAHPQQVSWTILPMLMVGVGGLAGLVGVFFLLFRDGNSWFVILVPIAVCALAVFLVTKGIALMRRGDQHNVDRAESRGERPRKKRKRKNGPARHHDADAS